MFVLKVLNMAVSRLVCGKTLDIGTFTTVEVKTAQIGLYGFGLLVGFCCFLLQYYGYGVLLLMK